MEVDTEDQEDADEDRRLHEQQITATDEDDNEEWEDFEAYQEQEAKHATNIQANRRSRTQPREQRR